MCYLFHMSNDLWVLVGRQWSDVISIKTRSRPSTPPLRMARESHHCMESCGQPSSPEVAFSHTAVFDPHNWRGEDGLFECKWNPYWVYCKYHGWQQCPACSSEIAILHATLCADRTLPPRKNMSLSCDDELTTVQILAFVSNLKVEQICIAASALLEHYTKGNL